MVYDSIMKIFLHLSTNPVNVISNRFKSGTTTTTSTTRTTRTTTTDTTPTASTVTASTSTWTLPKTDHMSDQRAAINQNYQFFGWGAKNYNYLNETGTEEVAVQNS